MSWARRTRWKFRLCSIRFRSRTGPQGLCGENPPQQLATRVHGLWVQFAKTGTLPWPEFDRDTRQVYRLEAGEATHEAVMPAAPFLP